MKMATFHPCSKLALAILIVSLGDPALYADVVYLMKDFARLKGPYAAFQTDFVVQVCGSRIYIGSVFISM